MPDNSRVIETAEPSARSLREAARKRDIEAAAPVLRGRRLPVREVYALAEQLKNNNEFGYARKLYGHIRRVGDDHDLGKTPAKVGQRHALCTYKDPDLPARDRFKRALEILDEVERMGPTAEERQESLGLRGAINKRLWQVDGQRADLERSLGFYLQGYEMGPAKDQGYTGINAAFILDLLAKEDATEAAKTGAKQTVAGGRWQQAHDIREHLAKLLAGLPERAGYEWLAKEWWFYTTRAETHLGLGQFGQALTALRGYNTAHRLNHQGPPLESVAPWEFESAITQLASLAQLQADLAELLGSRTEWTGRWAGSPDELRSQGKSILREYLGDLAPGVDRATDGKVGLALSGGGFRASLFHIGVLACLAETDILRRVEVLSCVSGGSIVGAHYYLEVKRLLESKRDGEITREDYLEIVRRLERDFLTGVQTNIRCRLFGSIWSNLRTLLQPGYTTTRRLGELYEQELYARVPDGKGGKPRYLKDLFVQCESPDFKPKYDNWLRAAKVPVLVLNATTLNTGHNWQFTASWMGEPPMSLDAEVEGNYRLRRMYYWEAPRLEDRWRGWLGRLLAPLFGPPDYQRLRLGEAVAASSCVPGLFDPLVFPDLYEGKTVRLVDGGVYDNQGVASLLEQDCNVMIVSDASGQMDSQDHPSGGRVGVPLRSSSISMARVRQAQYRELDARRRSGLVKQLTFLHLKKDLDADPIDWRECQDPHEASDDARPVARRGVLTLFGIQKPVQRLLSALRTDLDSFTEVEAFALMTSGYRQAQTELRQRAETALPDGGWRFLQIEPALNPGPGFDRLTRHLAVGSLLAGKVWLLWPPLTVAAAVFLLGALVGVWWLWQTYQSLVLVTVRGLGVFLIGLAVTLLAPHLVRLMRYRQTFRDVGLRSVLAAALAIGFKIHLLVFDPIFIWLGKADRLLNLRR
ncbi:MAG: tetratricopeptide repeat-containing protein [Bryobacteraceae bacterium]